MAAISFKNVAKSYSGERPVIQDLNLEIADGEFLVLVGPSGSGKSTALRMVAGLEEMTGGHITIGGKDVTHVEPKNRDVAMVFQNYALYPHMTVAKNMSFALELAGVSLDERQRRIGEAAALLGLEQFLTRKPSQLSGGQRQRVAMGRAIVREPQVFLMDEPLSNLDAKLRVSMRSVIAALHKRLGVTTIYVTHDQVEAMTLGQRVAVLHEGVLQQIDTPTRLFEAPANLFVASFIGSPSINLARARIVRDGGLFAVFGGMRLAIPASLADSFADLSAYEGKELIVGLRPHSFEDAELGNVAHPQIEVRPLTIESLGSEVKVIFELDQGGDAGATGILLEDAGAADAALRRTWTARVNAKTDIRPDVPARLSIDATGLQLFDPATGRAVTKRNLS